MMRLPLFALEEIAEFLDPKTAFFSFPLVCRSLSTVMLDEALLTRYMRNVLRLQQDYQISRSSVPRILLRFTNEKTTLVPFTALATTGGIDENKMYYWLQNMFKPRVQNAYCSRDHKNNIVCSGVLSVLVDKPPTAELTSARTRVATLLRKNEELRRLAGDIQPADSDVDLTEYEREVFFELIRLNPFIMMQRNDNWNGDEQERFIEFRREIQEIVTVMRSEELKFKDIKRREDDDYYLERIIPLDQVSEGKQVFIAKKVIVSREGRYTCPLETFVVFFSEEYISVESDLFKPYDNLLTVANVLALVNEGGPEVLRKDETDDLVYIEFQRKLRNCLHPVIWGKFKTRQGEEIKAPLAQPFCAKFIYIKLINPENRMAEMRDPHDFTNIDVQFLGVKGIVETLS